MIYLVLTFPPSASVNQVEDVSRHMRGRLSATVYGWPRGKTEVVSFGLLQLQLCSGASLYCPSYPPINLRGRDAYTTLSESLLSSVSPWPELPAILSLKDMQRPVQGKALPSKEPELLESVQQRVSRVACPCNSSKKFGLQS